MLRLLALALVVTAGSLLTQLGHANTYTSRQYYGGWKKHPTKSYSYRPYYYKPHKNYYGWKHHYVTYHPRQNKHYYFYNPYSKKYWGRCPISSDGSPSYEILDEADRKGDIKEIPEKSFKKIPKMPPIPDSKDDVPMDLPPDDGPPQETDRQEK